MTPNLATHQVRALRNRRILLVEDDDDILESMSSILEAEGYEVDVCSNGKQALERLCQSPADAIVLDLMMPVMDGWQFVTAKAADPSIAHIPVLATSANNSAQATAVRADAFIPKPFDANDLVVAVGRVLLESDRRRLAQRLDETERLTVLGTIAAGVGHEISNPLCGVLATVETIERTLSSVRDEVHRASSSGKDEGVAGRIGGRLDRIQDQLRDCHTGLDRIRAIVGDLRTISRRAGDERALVDLRPLMESVIVMASGEMATGVDLVREYRAEPRVVGNETRLSQVFLNLLVNAAQAIPSDRSEPHRITIAIRSEAEWAIVEIRDTGRGMSAIQMERIFEPFFTTRGQQGGTGLGLAISKEIVEAHGGTIDLASEIGRGSALTVRLPLSSG